MKTTRAIVLVIAALLPIAGNCQDERIGRIVSRLLDSEIPDLSLVTPDVRDEVIHRIRGSSGDSFEQTIGKTRGYYLLLVKLGDEDATRQVVAAMRPSLPKKGPANLWLSFLEDNAQPVIIPLIAGDFFLNDGDEQIVAVSGDEGFDVRPVSIEMCWLALTVVRRNESFSPETKSWAKDKQNWRKTDFGALGELRKEMQQWWRANEAHFRARDYQAVRPGETLSSAAAQTPVRSEDPRGQPAPTRRTPSDVGTPSQPGTAAPRPKLVECRSSAWWWAGMATISVIGLLIWRRRIH